MHAHRARRQDLAVLWHHRQVENVASLRNSEFLPKKQAKRKERKKLIFTTIILLQLDSFCSLINFKNISARARVWSFSLNSVEALKLVSTRVGHTSLESQLSRWGGDSKCHARLITKASSCLLVTSQPALSSASAFWQAHRLNLRGATRSDTALFGIPH